MSGRKMTPRGQMSRSANNQPAVMMMPPHIRSTFMPNPPINQLPPPTKNKRRKQIQGVFQFLDRFEKAIPPERNVQPTPNSLKRKKSKIQSERLREQRKSMIDEYRQFQKDCGGEYEGMNCYNTLFIGRLAYEVKERKLLREMEAFGPVKDIKLITDKKTGKSRGIGFVEYENEEEMKRAFRAADGMKIEGREIVVDVERGHTVPTWLPRRLGGGFGGTRLGGKDRNVTIPGRFDPNRMVERPSRMMMSEINDCGPLPPVRGGLGRGQGLLNSGGYYDGPPPAQYDDYHYGAPVHSRGVGGASERRRRRSRSRSPDRGRYTPRQRY